MDAKLSVGGFVVADENPPLIIAEIGNNHDGDLDQAKRLVAAAAEAGADAVKFQTYDPDRLVRPGHQLYDFFKRYLLPRSWHEVLKAEGGVRRPPLPQHALRSRRRGVPRFARGAGAENRLLRPHQSPAGACLRVAPPAPAAQQRHGVPSTRSPQLWRRRVRRDATSWPCCTASRSTRRRPRRSACAPFPRCANASACRSASPTTA